MLRLQLPWSRRRAFLFATIAMGVTLTLITELLSLFQLLRRDALLAAWITVLCSSSAVYAWLRYRRAGWNFAALASVRRRWRGALEKPPADMTIMLLLIAFQVLTLGMAAYLFAPNTWDSMTYHLTRVIHWQQQQSVWHYATNNERQIQLAPFAEFVIAHLQIMLMGDQFVNLVQWFAMVVCLIGVSEIARILGADVRGQIIAALLCASIPMGILQATSTQNDYVVAAWLVCFVVFGLLALQEAPRWSYIAGLGMALGLALLSKATAYLFAAPFCLLIGAVLLYRLRQRAIIPGMVIALAILALNAGHLTRNALLYGSPLAGLDDIVTNEIFTASATFSTMIRNTALHLPLQTNIELIDRIGGLGLAWLRMLHEFTGLDPLDPRTTYAGASAFALGFSFDEDHSGNLTHTILIITTMSLGAISLLRQSRHFVLGYIIVLFGAFVLFSLYLRWQVWHSRLQLPLFVLWCPAIAVAFFSHRRPLLAAIPILIGIVSLNWIFHNATRPINSDAVYAQRVRTEQYFTKQPDLLPVFRRLADTIASSSCSQVGLAFGFDTWEYPLLMQLRERGFQGSVRHVNVNNPSRAYLPPDFQPCLIVVDGEQFQPPGFFGQAFGEFYLYGSPAIFPSPGELPPGFAVSPTIGVVLGAGWYDFEPEWNVRWMQGRGRLWVYAEQETRAALHLQPHVMHADGTFGEHGQLQVKVNGLQAAPVEVTSRVTSTFALALHPGFNTIDLELDAGAFVPGNGDDRSLGIAFFPIGIETTP